MGFAMAAVLLLDLAVLGTDGYLLSHRSTTTAVNLQDALTNFRGSGAAAGAAREGRGLDVGGRRRDHDRPDGSVADHSGPSLHGRSDGIEPDGTGPRGSGRGPGPTDDGDRPGRAAGRRRVRVPDLGR